MWISYDDSDKQMLIDPFVCRNYNVCKSIYSVDRSTVFLRDLVQFSVDRSTVEFGN